MASGYLLDANIVRLYGSGHGPTIERIHRNTDRVWLSSVTAEEMIVGVLNTINRARSRKITLPLPEAHEEFIELLIGIRLFPFHTYSAEAEKIFKTFSPATRRIGPQDCRLASQALAHDLIVVTRNLRDFEAIGAHCEDWSA